MVDIWLISSQLVPFIEVLIVTMKEYFNESENINHHGMHVRVIDKTMLLKTKRNRIVILGEIYKYVIFFITALFSEKWVVPLTVLGFSSIYWVFAGLIFFDVIITY